MHPLISYSVGVLVGVLIGIILTVRYININKNKVVK